MITDLWEELVTSLVAGKGWAIWGPGPTVREAHQFALWRPP
jgi:hypothetical protein